MKGNYTKYKSTDISWIPEIPEHWKISRVKNHFAFPKNVAGDNFLDYKVLSLSINGVIIRDMDSGKGKFSLSMETYQVAFPDNIILCLFDMDVTPRIVGYCKNKGIITSAYTIITPKQNIFSKYYYYYFLTQDHNKSLFAQGTGVRATLTNFQFGSLPVPLPPVEEQTAIANYLDAQDEKINLFIAKKQKLIGLLKLQKQAIITEKLTSNSNDGKSNSTKWKNWKLKFVVSKVGGGVTPTGGATTYLPSGIPLLRSQNIYSDRLVLDDVAFISQETNNSMSGSKVQAGDVLLNITGGSLGRCFYADENLGEANVNQHISIIRPKQNRITTEFLHLLLVSEIGQKQINFEQTGGNREGLTAFAIKNFKFPLPPIEVQKELVKQINEETNRVDDAVKTIEKEIELIKEYKQSIIAEVVTGKIKVTDT